MMLAALLPEEEIDRGMVEKFLQELPEKAWNLGTRIVLSALVLFLGIQLIKVIRGLVKKSLAKGNADKGFPLCRATHHHSFRFRIGCGKYTGTAWIGRCGHRPCHSGQLIQLCGRGVNPPVKAF